MRIAYLVPSLSNKGPINVVKDLVRVLHGQVSQIVVFYFDESKALDFRCNTERIDFNSSFEFSGFDIVHSHGLRPDAFIWRNRKKIRCKTVTTLHNYMKEELQFTYNRLVSWLVTPLWKKFVSSQDQIIVLSRHMFEYYVREGLPRDKLGYIHNGRAVCEVKAPVDHSDLKKIVELKARFTLIGLIGFLTKRKGAHQLVQLLAVNSRCAVLIIGDGPERNSLLQLAKRLNVSDRLCILGYRESPQQYLPYLDVYAMTSYSEGFPLALLEAGLSRRKTVCADLPLFRELFDETQLAFFELENISSLNMAVNTARNDSEMAENLYQTIVTRYSVQYMAENYLLTYRKALT